MFGFVRLVFRWVMRAATREHLRNASLDYANKGSIRKREQNL